MGCATPTVAVELSGRPIRTQGWVAMNDYGTNWQLRSEAGGKLVVVGKCIRTEYDVDNKGEYWYGAYTKGYTDFNGYEEFEENFGSLYDCVKWVEHYAYGGYFI